MRRNSSTTVVMFLLNVFVFSILAILYKPLRDILYISISIFINGIILFKLELLIVLSGIITAILFINLDRKKKRRHR